MIKDTAEYWRGRADEARAVAEQMSDPVAKATMLRIADRYELLAKQSAHAGDAIPETPKEFDSKSTDRAK